MEWEFNSYYTLIAATLVLLVGKFLVQKIKFLRDFNIPEPVAGGLVAAIVLFALHEAYGVSFKFEKPLQDAFMLIFFTSIGLSADFSRLKAGGLPLVIFTAVVGAFIIVQNFVGVGLASALGLDPLIGLITGSITLTGGHGTAGAWGPDFESKFGLTGATGLGMASATFGLVFGGLIGGPVARRLINKMGRKPLETNKKPVDNDQTDDVFENRFAVFVGGVEQGGAERVVFKGQVAAHQFLFEHVGQRGAAVNQRAVVYGRFEDGVGNTDFEVGAADGFAVVFGFFGVFKQGF